MKLVFFAAIGRVGVTYLTFGNHLRLNPVGVIAAEKLKLQESCSHFPFSFPVIFVNKPALLLQERRRNAKERIHGIKFRDELSGYSSD